MNVCMFIGNLTRDIEIKFTPKGTAVGSGGIAVNRKWKTESGEKREEVTFIDYECWGNLATVMGDWTHKGDKIMLSGRLKLDTWDDKATGQKRSKLKLVVENMELLGNKGGGRAPSDEDDPNPKRGKSSTTKPDPSDNDGDQAPGGEPDPLDPPKDDVPY